MRHCLKTVSNRAGRCRQLEGERDATVATDDKVFDHAQAHDVTPEVGVLDRGQHGQDLV